MIKTLEKRSTIFIEKSKFFISRLLLYFGFMLLPVWIQKSVELNLFTQSMMMLCYLLFMGGQWYLLGKEVDHRLRIYFRANSTVDRILYRLIIGHGLMILLFNVMSFIPSEIVRHFFWAFFIVLGLFYSWPTRGKIIEESVTTQFTEYKYLDSFEKTVLLLVFIMFLVSMPSFPFISNLETYKLVVDPEEKMNTQLWNFLEINFLPFRRFPHLVNLGWSMHFYFVGIVFYLLAFYGIMRFMISRRLSILGLFAVLSTWSFSIFLKKDAFFCISTMFSVLWVWGVLWCAKSATYRSGLMFGLLCYFGVVLNFNYFFLFPIGLALLYFLILKKDHTQWYRTQFVKYTSLGMFLILITLITHVDLNFFSQSMSSHEFLNYFKVVFERKAFFSLSIIGLFFLLLLFIFPQWKKFNGLMIDQLCLKEFALLVSILILSGLFIEKDLIRGLGMLWLLAFFSVLPLEGVFQALSRVRSRRNFIYAVYILVCLLDSHFEGRVRILYNFYQSPPDIVDLKSRE